MKLTWLTVIGVGAYLSLVHSAEFRPVPQSFLQEVSRHVAPPTTGTAPQELQFLSIGPVQQIQGFADGHWFELDGANWHERIDLAPQTRDEFKLPDDSGQVVRLALPWSQVREVLRLSTSVLVATSNRIYRVADGQAAPLDWPIAERIQQVAGSASGRVVVASSDGLRERTADKWRSLEIRDEGGRAWGKQDVLGVAFDAQDRLWFATRAGASCETATGWRFFEGKDGLPWNDFTGLAADGAGNVWFATHLGIVRFNGAEWDYRQGPRWLPNDDVRQILVEPEGRVWCLTAKGIGALERRPMTLAEKALFFEDEIERYIQRTSFGFVAEAPLERPGAKETAHPQDSDNDGLWTAMYGAGECFAYGSTSDENARKRAKKAFDALRFLQSVTQGGSHSPPPGYIARTIRPSNWPDPNLGRMERDLADQKHDSLWKAYEPRWPKSADGRWFWKSDTSSDELDGHYFFYPLYYDLCADTEAEKDKVRDVVRGITDHLLTHNYTLVDHDGRPTRWAVYGPQYLNRHPLWWPERGLNSLSVLSYLAVAEHVTGDPKYATAAQELIDRHGYAHNAMYPKVQLGTGSGNQSDDEMAFMCYYNLLRYSKNESLKGMIRDSFYRYWINEWPEMNPFFNFAYAAQNLRATGSNPWGKFSLEPWAGWLDDAMSTLYGLPLDRLNWPHRNSHRLDLIRLTASQSSDVSSPDRHPRGYRRNGKVLPVSNRHFNHWNTDPWQLDYSGDGNELAAGTVYLLPYYLGVYHQFIERPAH